MKSCWIVVKDHKAALEWRDLPVPQPKVIVKNQFGSTQFTVGRSGLLCVPSFKQVLQQ